AGAREDVVAGHAGHAEPAVTRHGPAGWSTAGLPQAPARAGRTPAAPANEPAQAVRAATRPLLRTRRRRPLSRVPDSRAAHHPHSAAAAGTRRAAGRRDGRIRRALTLTNTPRTAPQRLVDRGDSKSHGVRSVVGLPGRCPQRAPLDPTELGVRDRVAGQAP